MPSVYGRDTFFFKFLENKENFLEKKFTNSAFLTSVTILCYNQGLNFLKA